MASAPTESRPICGRVDADGRLISADPELAALQVEAGSHLGALLALPQVAAIARLARKLGIPVARRALAAGAEQDIDMWVRAVPEGHEVALTIEQWTYQAASPARLSALVADAKGPDFSEDEGSWSADEQLRLNSVSPALSKILSLGLGEGVGQPLTRLFRLEEDEAGELPILSALASRRDFAGQRVRARSGGAQLLLSGSAVIGPDGDFAGFSGCAVAAAESDPGAATAAVAPIDASLDEALRLPLVRIIDSAEAITGGSDGPLQSEYAGYAADISTAARHLLGVIRSMRGEAGGEQDRINLAQLASDAVVLLETSAEAGRVLLALEPVGPLMARGDRAGVIQIIVNLIGNAIRHSPEGAIVAVSFDSSDDNIAVHVSDLGPGIDPADQQRIFERFEKADDKGGTGLGLAISRRLARSMGGDILLESAPGEGARFTLVLPVG